MNPFFVLLHNAPQCIYLFIYQLSLHSQQSITDCFKRSIFILRDHTVKCCRKLWSTMDGGMFKKDWSNVVF